MAFRLVELCFAWTMSTAPGRGGGVLKGQFSCASARPPTPARPSRLKARGHLREPAYGRAVVRREGGVLRIALGPAKRGGVLVRLRNSYDFAWTTGRAAHPLTSRPTRPGKYTS